MASESISVKIDGQTWYCDSEKVKNQIESIKDKEAQKTVLESLSTGANPLVSKDENAFVDTSNMTEEDDDMQTTSSGVEKAETVKGYDKEAYEAFVKDGNFEAFSSVTDKSSSSDIEKALTEITNKVKELDSSVEALKSCETPEDIESVFSTITNLQTALNNLSGNCESATPDEPKKSSGLGTALGLTVGTAGSVWGGIGVLGAIALGSNPIGWGAAAIGSIALGGAALAKSIQNSNASKETSRYKDVQAKIDEAKRELETKKSTAQENVNTALSTLMNEKSQNIAEIFSSDDTLDFSNATPFAISNNLENIQKLQTELQSFFDVCGKYGLETKELTTNLELLKGESGTSFAQAYLDSYAQNLSAQATGEVVSDTTNYSTLYTELSLLEEKAKSSGLDTSNLVVAMESIKSKNCADVDSEADLIANQAQEAGGDLAGMVANQMDGAALAQQEADGVADNSTAYDVSTDSLNQTANALSAKSQEEIQAYADGIDVSKYTDLPALDTVYKEVNENYTQLQESSTGLDLSPLETKLGEITDAENAIVTAKQDEFENLLNSATTAYECADVENKISDYLNEISAYDVDTAGLMALKVAAGVKKGEISNDSEVDSPKDDETSLAAQKEKMNDLLDSIDECKTKFEKWKKKVDKAIKQPITENERQYLLDIYFPINEEYHRLSNQFTNDISQEAKSEYPKKAYKIREALDQTLDLFIDTNNRLAAAPSAESELSGDDDEPVYEEADE